MKSLAKFGFLLNISGSFFHSKSVPTLILAGIPNRVFRRHDGEDPSIQLNGWNLELFPALQDAASVSKCWAAVLERIAQLDVNNDHDGIHVFAFEKDELAFNEKDVALRDHHRVRLLERRLLQDYRTQAFNAELDRLVNIEETWRTHLKPMHYGQPPILPENYFAAKGDFKAIWKRLRDFDGTQSVADIRRSIDLFPEAHLPRYLDERELRFNVGGARHYLNRNPIKHWKMNLRLPDSFHFDVSHERERPFQFKCRDQNRRTYNTHCNLDAFGYEAG